MRSSLMTISLPENILAAIHETMGGEPTRVYPVGGGMINQSVWVEVNGERYFVKWKYESPTGMFALEARGLELLRSADAFRIPDVIAHGEANGDLPGFLVLEWMSSEAKVDQRR